MSLLVWEDDCRPVGFNLGPESAVWGSDRSEPTQSSVFFSFTHNIFLLHCIQEFNCPQSLNPTMRAELKMSKIRDKVLKLN